MPFLSDKSSDGFKRSAPTVSGSLTPWSDQKILVRVCAVAASPVGEGEALAAALHAGAARRVVNPPLGTRQTGFRLFGNPVQAIESDLTATALVLASGRAKVVVVAIDLSIVGIDLAVRNQRPAQEMRVRIADALGIPVSHVLLNTSHAHSGVALPDYMPDTAEQMALKERYRESLIRGLVEAAAEADRRLQPARIGCGWGESTIGVYRRETRDGRDVLGEVPDHPIDPSVGVIRVDDLDGDPIAVAFRYSCHPVTMGPRSAVVSSDFPGVARRAVETSVGGLALFLQGGGGNINPRAGMGYEVDCRATKERVGLELGGEVVKVAAGIRTNTRPGDRRTLGNVPNVLFTPWEPVDAPASTHLAAAEATVTLDYVDLPTREEAQAILAERRSILRARQANDAPEWEVRVAEKYEDWARLLVEAASVDHPTCELFVQAIRVDDIVIAGMNAELFFETGLEIRDRSPFPHTFALGYTNGTIGYLPRAGDYPPGGWDVRATYAVPDLIFQVHPHPVALNPDSERRAVEASLALLQGLSDVNHPSSS
jgi:neutral ceramidase